MRLLVIAPHYLTFIKSLTETIAEDIEHIDVFVPYNKIGKYFKLFPLNKIHNKLSTYIRKQYKDELIDANKIPPNVKIHTIPLWQLVPSSRDKTLYNKVAKNIKKCILQKNIDFDLIHAHFTYPAGYAGIILKKEFRKPVVITAHGYDIYDLPFRSKRWFKIIKHTLDKADFIITVGKENLQYIRKISKNKQTKIIPNGFDKKLFYPQQKDVIRQKLDLPKNKHIILTVGNLVNIKGQKYLISAMKNVPKEAILYIIGSGPLRQGLRKQIEENKLTDRVFLIGGKPHSEIPLWMNAADLFVLPSLKESFGIVTIEALACGIPVVATKTGIAQDLLNSTTGFIVDIKSPDQLADKINQALKKKWDRNTIADSVKKFTWENIAKQTISVYEQVLNRNN